MFTPYSFYTGTKTIPDRPYLGAMSLTGRSCTALVEIVTYRVICVGTKAQGGTPGNSWSGFVVLFPNPDPQFRPENAIFHTVPFSDLAFRQKLW